jgi:hypothetical protein
VKDDCLDRKTMYNFYNKDINLTRD